MGEILFEIMLQFIKEFLYDKMSQLVYFAVKFSLVYRTTEHMQA